MGFSGMKLDSIGASILRDQKHISGNIPIVFGYKHLIGMIAKDKRQHIGIEMEHRGKARVQFSYSLNISCFAGSEYH
jgi:hypothetical protein